MKPFFVCARDEAQAAVELALVLPVLLLITVAVCQVALALTATW